MTDGAFAPEVLLQLRFDSIKQAHSYLSIEAKKRGWDIACNESFKAAWVTFYCTKGGRIRGGRTRKTGCEWKLGIGPTEDGKWHITKPPTKEHNHRLTPEKFATFTLPDETLDLIRQMLDAGIEPSKIQRFLARNGTDDVTTLQIRKIAGRDDSIALPETEDLREYMRDVGGLFERMEVRIADSVYVHAVYTATPFELENLKRFGNVIWLDGTQRQNRLRWEIMPVTLIDPFKRIRSGGVFFVSRSDQTIIKWVLETLLKNEELVSILQTVITDEDSAFIPAFCQVMREHPDLNVAHVLCAFHKEQNYMRKVAKAGLTHVQRETARDLFKVVCYSPHRMACEEALKDIAGLSPKLSKYLEKHVRPVLDKFARSHLGNVFTKGYNTTSPAESHNNQLKRTMIDGRVYTLKQMRMDITLSHRNAELVARERMASSFVNDHFTLDRYDVMLSPSIRGEIDAALAQAEALVCEPEKGIVFHPDVPQYPFHVVLEDEITCDCGRIGHAGMACPHILAAIANESGDPREHFPIELYDPWFIDTEDAVLIPVNRHGALAEDSDEEEDKDENKEDVMADSFPAGNPLEDADTKGLPFGERDAITLLTDKPRFTEQKERYLSLLHLAKCIASMGSRNRDVSVRVTDELQGLLDRLLDLPETTAGASAGTSDDSDEPPTETHVVDVHDASHRSRGRPRKRESPIEAFRANRTCILCGKRHPLEHCDRYPEYAAAVDHNLENVEDTGHRRCSICAGIGHNKKTCPWIHRK